MRPLVLPAIERAVRRGLVKRGFSSAMVATPLGRAHVYDAPGSGPLPTIVVLHGLSATSTSFAGVLARLQRRAKRVVAIDYPGHGFSEDPSSTLTPELLFATTSAMLDGVLRGDDVVVVGNSLGGAVAFDYATKSPERVRGLVLLSPAGAPFSEREWTDLFASFSVTSRREALELLHRIQHAAPFAVRLIAHDVVANVNRRAVRDLLATTSRAHVIPPDAVSQLAMPVLFSWGRSEKLLPPSHLVWWKEHLPPHATVEEPDRLGHCPHLDSPSRVAERIALFAATLAA